MPFLMLLMVIVAIMAGIGVIGLSIGLFVLVLKFALPLIIVAMIIHFILRAVAGPSRRHTHANWQQPDYSYQTRHDQRQRKEARDVKVDDDDWSDF